jgi:hypothetical protein
MRIDNEGDVMAVFFYETGGGKTLTDYILKRTNSAKANYIRKQKIDGKKIAIT